MKVGIIKGLLYYYDEVLWMSFFENLGLKTITHNEVTKETIKKGTFPPRVYHYLTQKKHIFLNSMKSISFGKKISLSYLKILVLSIP